MPDIVDKAIEDEFVQSLEARGLSKATVKSYRYGLRRFSRWYLLSRGKVLEPSELTQSDIDDYQEYLWGRRYAGGSVWVFLSGAKAFFAWATESESN